MTPPLVIPPYLKEAPLTGLIGMGGGATSRRFYTASSSDSYQITKSIRFEEDDTPSLRGRRNSEGNRRTWTLSYWCKRNTLGAYGEHIATQGGTPWCTFQFHTSDQYQFNYGAGGGGGYIQTNSTFRDTSAWYHICLVWDTLNPIENERARIYINGKKQDVTASGSGFPSLGQETPAAGWNDNGSTIYIGGGGMDTNDDTLADIQHIDGLACGPAPFGEFDSVGNWNPKAFALPAPNNGTVWSDTVTSETGSFYTGNGPTGLFNGIVGQGNVGESVDDATQAKWVKFTAPGDGIAFTQGVRVQHYAGSSSPKLIVDYSLKLKDGPLIKVRRQPDDSKWMVLYEGSGTIEYIVSDPPTGYNNWSAIEVDGSMLIDSKTDPETFQMLLNDGGKHSDNVSGTAYSGSYPASNAFNGLCTSGTASHRAVPASETWFTWTPPTAISMKKLRVWFGYKTTDGNFKINGVQNNTNLFSGTDGWIEYTGYTSISSIAWYCGPSGNEQSSVGAIEIDGVMLLDDSCDNSFHLKFDDTTAHRYLGRDTLKGKISDATGGLPVHETTDDYGETKGSGERTDSDSANLQLAIGNTFADVSGNSTNVSESGCVITTEESRFYGSSIKFDGNGDKITTAGSLWSANGDQTFEAWIWVDNTSSQRGLFHTSDNYYGDFSIHTNGAIRIHTNANNYQDTVQYLSMKTWHHVALVQGSNFRDVYVDGAKWEFGSATGSPQTQAWHNHDGTIVIGDQGQRAFFTGYMSDIRIYNKQKYTANFKPPVRNDFQVVRCDAGIEVSSATGGKPIRETTDSPNYGRTAHGSNLNSDDNSSYLVLAVPFNAATPADVSHTIRGSGSAKALTVSGSNSVAQQVGAKYYGSCFDFNASTHNTDYISADSTSSDFAFGTGAFTIEFWYRWNAAIDTNTSDVFFGQGAVASNTLQLYMSGKDTFVVRWGGNPDYHFCDSSDLNDNGKTWHHFALVRISASTNQTKFFIDGEEKEYFTCGGNITAESFNAGAFSGQTSYYNTGMMQDLRVYKGVAKYKSNFTVPSSIENIDTSTDTPTNYGTDSGAGGEVRGNFATLNPRDTGGGGTASQGNLSFSTSGAGGARASIGMSSGKWYTEVVLGHGSFTVGITKGQSAISSYLGNSANEWSYGQNGNKIEYGSQGAYGDTYGLYDTIGVAFDADGGNLYFYKNGTVQNSGTAAFTGLTDGPYFFAAGNNVSTSACHFNFGQKPWRYAPPSGYKALCTQNMDDIFGSNSDTNDPSKYFDIVTYTGDESSDRDITALNFQPEFVWIKDRTTAYSHILQDAVRGANKYISADADSAEGTDNNAINSFISRGFNIGGDYWLNKANDNYVAWCWDAGTSVASTSNSGTATNYTRWTNDTAGFSIMTADCGPGGGYYSTTVDHGLSAAPNFILSKSRDGAENWHVYHSGMGTGYVGYLNTNAVWSSADAHKVGAVSSTQITYENYGHNELVFYCWRDIPGFSKFGAYEGTANADTGPFIYTGFRPRWLLTRFADDAAGWALHDTSRDIDGNGGYTYSLETQTDAAEDTTSNDTGTDILSNGFKPTSTWNPSNGNGTVIYAAFAESPFKTARAYGPSGSGV